MAVNTVEIFCVFLLQQCCSGEGAVTARHCEHGLQPLLQLSDGMGILFKRCIMLCLHAYTCKCLQ